MKMFEFLKHTAVADRALRRPPFLYEQSMTHLRHIEELNAEDRRELHRQAIAEVLLQAARLPGYAHVPPSDRLQDWPILTKQDILGSEQMFARPSLVPLPRAETGGTTGQPMRIVRSIGNIVREQTMIDTLCYARGINVRRARIAILRGDGLLLPNMDRQEFWIDEGSKKRLYSAHHITSDTLQFYIASLRQYAPDILFCYPSSLASLIAGITPLDGVHIPVVFSSSEILSPELGAQARARLGCDIIDYYGHAERIACAYAVNGKEYRFAPGYGHVELIPCGGGRARIIATSLFPHGQIFVRYDTGDIALTNTNDPEALEKIALGCEPFSGIEGRESEFIELPDGRRIIGLNHIPRGADGAVSVQIHHAAPNCVDIYAVPASGFSADTRDRIVANFYNKFPRDVSMRLWTVSSPLRQKNGKAPLLLRDLNIPQTRKLAVQIDASRDAA